MSKYFSKEKWKMLLYLLGHPADGFYEIRHNDKGSVPIAILMILLYSVVITFNMMSSGFVVNNTEPNSIDILSVTFGWLVGYVLFSVGNWSITCLMSGEGRLKDIMIVIGYSTLPMSFFTVIATIFSWGITEEEAAFYNMIIGIGTVWTVFLALLGIMTVHNYTLFKTIATVVCTVFAMAIIIFIYLMFTDLIGQVITFFKSIYTELIFR